MTCREGRSRALTPPSPDPSAPPLQKFLQRGEMRFIMGNVFQAIFGT